MPNPNQAELMARLGVTGMSPRAAAKLQAATPTRDAASALYQRSPNGGLRGRFRPELSDNDLPASVEALESQMISEGHGCAEPNGESWQIQADDETDIDAIRRLNRRHAERYAGQGEGAWAEAPNMSEPARSYYAATVRGHEPGNPPVSGPNVRRYGETGEGSARNDYISLRGVDPVAETRSPPPPKGDPAGAYLRATNYFGDEPQPLSRPYTAATYPSGPDVQVMPQASAYATNFGIATPNVGDPDRWTNQRGADPSRYDPRPAALQIAARNRAEDEAVGLRVLNRLHHDRYDLGIRRRPLSWNYAMRGM